MTTRNAFQANLPKPNPPDMLQARLADNGPIPNNWLPLVLYRRVFTAESGGPEDFEQLFAANGWVGSWRNGIYPYHHYHSTAHEVLGIVEGAARVQVGGEGGTIQDVRAGDVLVIPAGVGHKNLGSSDGFLVVGAYPEGQEADLCRGEAGERPRTDQNIARVGLPGADPVYGANGPLLQAWASRSIR